MSRPYAAASLDAINHDLKFYTELIGINTRAKKGICEAAEKIFDNCYQPSITRWKQTVEACREELVSRGLPVPDTLNQ